MNDLRKAAEMALEALEALWGILDDIDTASDMAKENDAWYRKRVEALQKKRWDTMITTDGYKLRGGPVEALRQALRQALAQPERVQFKCTVVDDDHPNGVPLSQWGKQPTLEQTVSMTEYKRLQDLVTSQGIRLMEYESEHEPEPVAWMHTSASGHVYFRKKPHDRVFNPRPVYAWPPQKTWVSLTDDDIWEAFKQYDTMQYVAFSKAIEAKLREKNS